MLCRVEMIDVVEEATSLISAQPPPPGRAPTEVNARLAARRRLHVLGPAGMAVRCGRFRRGYASDELDGPYSVGLGWGVEKFVDGAAGVAALPEQSDGNARGSDAAVQPVLEGDDELLFAPYAERVAATAAAPAADEGTGADEARMGRRRRRRRATVPVARLLAEPGGRRGHVRQRRRHCGRAHRARLAGCGATRARCWLACSRSWGRAAVCADGAGAVGRGLTVGARRRARGARRRSRGAERARAPRHRGRGGAPIHRQPRGVRPPP